MLSKNLPTLVPPNFWTTQAPWPFWRNPSMSGDLVSLEPPTRSGRLLVDASRESVSSSGTGEDDEARGAESMGLIGVGSAGHRWLPVAPVSRRTVSRL